MNELGQVLSACSSSAGAGLPGKSPSATDWPLDNYKCSRVRQFGRHIGLLLDGQWLPDRTLLGNVAQPIERRWLGHWKIFRPAGRSGGVSASGGASLGSGGVSGIVRARMASSCSRATATSSSADIGRFAFKNLISGAPFINHRHANSVGYATNIDEMETRKTDATRIQSA